MNTTIQVYRADDLPSLGAYLRPDGPPQDTPMMFINVEALFDDFIDEDGITVDTTIEDRKRLFVETMMHEFGHVIEHMLGLEVNEDAIELAVLAWRERFAKDNV